MNGYGNCSSCYHCCPTQDGLCTLCFMREAWGKIATVRDALHGNRIRKCDFELCLKCYENGANDQFDKLSAEDQREHLDHTMS